MEKTSSLKRYQILLLLLLVPIVALLPCVVGGEIPGPFNQIRQMQPWNGPKPTQPWDVLQADGVLQFYPWRDMVLRSYASGHLPFWNHYELAGTPLLANSQSGGFYPPHILLGLLHVPTAPAILILCAFHLYWAALGVYLLTRRLGGSQVGSLIAGYGFGLSSFMLLWAPLASVISTVAWIPWLLLGVLWTCEGSKSRLSFPMSAFSAAMMVLAGHLQFVAYGFMAAVFLAIVFSLQRRRPLRMLSAFLALLVGLCLAAPQLLPVLNYSQTSHRKNTPTSEGYQAYVAGAIRPFELANLAVPNGLGDPRSGETTENGDVVSHYWPMYAKQGANLAEAAVTVGPFLLLLLFMVDWKEKAVQAIGALGLFALLIALGTVLNLPLYYLVPGWSSTGSPGRIVVLFVLAVCVLAGLGSSRNFDGKAWKVKVGAAALTVLVFTLALPALAPQWQPGLEQLGAAMKGIASLPALISVTVGGALSAVGLALLLSHKREFAHGAAVAGLAIGGFMNSPLLTYGKAIPVERPQTFERVAVVNAGWGIIAAAPAILPPNTAYLAGLHELGGYDSLLDRDTKALLDSINGQDSAPPANGNMMFIKPSAESAALANAGVTSIYSRNGIQAVDGPGRVSVDSGTAKIVSENPQQVKIEATGPGTLVLRDRHMPGWTAKVDGRAVSVKGTIWMEIELSAGEHQVEFDYVPPGWTTGLYLAGPAWLILIGVSLAAARRVKGSQKEAEADLPPLDAVIS